MKKIQLADGSEAIVDDIDYRHLSKWKWHRLAGGYPGRQIKEGGKTIRIKMHKEVAKRIGLGGRLIDHIDRNPLNNTRMNLRPVTKKQNSWNKSLCRNNTSGYRGVSKNQNSWSAKITIDGTHIHIGTFRLKEDAARAYNITALKYFGEFATFNDVNNPFEFEDPQLIWGKRLELLSIIEGDVPSHDSQCAHK